MRWIWCPTNVQHAGYRTDFVLGLAAEPQVCVLCTPTSGPSLLDGGLPDPCAVCSHPWGFRLNIFGNRVVSPISALMSSSCRGSWGPSVSGVCSINMDKPSPTALSRPQFSYPFLWEGVCPGLIGGV